MAESAIVSVASKILLTIASHAFEKAYEKVCSIREARDDLDKLKRSIQTIQAVLRDVEKRQQGSETVKDWIKRAKDVLYEADDLFDEVVTNDKLKQQHIKGDDKFNILEKVRVSRSKLNSVVSRNSIAKEIKAIKKSLLDISNDIAGLRSVSYDKLEEEMPTGLRRGRDPGSFVDSENVIGRDKEKAAILELLLHESHDVKPKVPVVIAIIGIGGMGKTTLAQLVYNDDKVQNHFEKTWFACISDVYDDKEVLGKIFQSICKINYSGINVSDLERKIRKSIEGKEFLLVLDDVWDGHRGRWKDRLSLFCDGAKGSRIIVTKRSSSVATAVDALETCTLGGLPEEDSWDLFKRLAFNPGNENDPKRNALGREIVKKCRNVPLAIKSIASLLSEKNTILEWESIRSEELPELEKSHEDGIMSVLKLSYDHLHSNLKHCFAYCSLFPRDYIIHKQNLVHLWIAQGYTSTNSEDVGHLYFMDLLRRGFFQEAKEDHTGEVTSCKMHDLIHDLARHVAGEETIVLTSSSHEGKCTRHVSISYSIDDSWVIPAQLLNSSRLRTFMFMGGSSVCRLVFDQLFTIYKCLRTLSLQSLGMKNVSRSIENLKHLRHLDLSRNEFKSLPDSITNLVNLLVLDLAYCHSLVALPNKFRKLVNLRYLNIRDCFLLDQMPPRIGDLTCLKYLSNFKVGFKGSGLVELAGLQQLRGELSIDFNRLIDNREGDECWQIPVYLQKLLIMEYQGRRIPKWANGSANHLTDLELGGCCKVKYLPSLSCLPNLKTLYLERFLELEYMEEEATRSTDDASTFFPRLEKLHLCTMVKLKGWRRRKVAAQPGDSQLTFPLVSKLTILNCPRLKFIPLCPSVRDLSLYEVDGEGISQLLSTWSNSSFPSSSTPSSSPPLQRISIYYCIGMMTFADAALISLRELNIERCESLKTLHLTSPRLKSISIEHCNELRSIHVAALPSLQTLIVNSCSQLKILHIAHLNKIDILAITLCPKLKLWGEEDEDEEKLDWDSLPNLKLLKISTDPPTELLPECLRQRQALGILRITSVEKMKSAMKAVPASTAANESSTSKC